MAEIILVTGGARSGKSDYALHRAEEIHGPRCFLATCEPLDTEMRERVNKHRKSRSRTLWETIEEPLEIASILEEKRDFRVYLIDCLTLWISNIMADGARSGYPVTEESMALRTAELLKGLEPLSSTIFIVTNEVGLGIVPDNETARKYRDLVGLSNRLIAEKADDVVLVSCGLPLHLKKKRD